MLAALACARASVHHLHQFRPIVRRRSWRRSSESYDGRPKSTPAPLAVPPRAPWRASEARSGPRRVLRSASMALQDDGASIAAALCVPVPFVLRYVTSREHAELLLEARAARAGGRARSACGACAARVLPCLVPCPSAEAPPSRRAGGCQRSGAAAPGGALRCDDGAGRRTSRRVCARARSVARAVAAHRGARPAPCVLQPSRAARCHARYAAAQPPVSKAKAEARSRRRRCLCWLPRLTPPPPRAPRCCAACAPWTPRCARASRGWSSPPPCAQTQPGTSQRTASWASPPHAAPSVASRMSWRAACARCASRAVTWTPCRRSLTWRNDWRTRRTRRRARPTPPRGRRCPRRRPPRLAVASGAVATTTMMTRAEVEETAEAPSGAAARAAMRAAAPASAPARMMRAGRG
jgi:hypothetical protein